MKMKRMTTTTQGDAAGSWGNRRKLGRPRDEPVWNWVGEGEPGSHPSLFGVNVIILWGAGYEGRGSVFSMFSEGR